MRQRIGEVVGYAYLTGGYLLLRGGSGDKEPQRSGDGGVAAEGQAEPPKKHPEKRKGEGGALRFGFGVLWTQWCFCRAYLVFLYSLSE